MIDGDTVVRFCGKIIAILLAVLYTTQAMAWWDCNWRYRTPVTIATDTATTDYVARVALTPTDFNADYTLSPDGDELRVLDSDDLTPLPYYLAQWDTINAEAVIYVQMPPLAASESRTIYLYYGETAVSSLSTATGTFPETGIKVHTRFTNANPTNKAEGYTAFESAPDGVTGYGCKLRNDIYRIRNQNEFPSGANGSYGWYNESFFYADTAGNWDFRYGPDYGRGGAIYIADDIVTEQWNDDLWWAYDITNPVETLSGSTTQDIGYHRIETLGFEGCCDGPIEFQFRKPGGAWQDFNTSTLTLLTRQCPAGTITITKAAPEACPIGMNTSKSVEIISDMLGNSSPYALQSSVVEYTIAIENTGQSVDDGTIIITDDLPPEIKLIVSGSSAFTLNEGTPNSNVTLA